MQTVNPQIASADESGASQVVVGLQGHVRLGHWAPLTFVFRDESLARRAATMTVSCPNDERAAVEWKQPASVITSPNAAGQMQWLVSGLFRLGSPHGTIAAQVLDSSGAIIAETAISLQGGAVRVVDGTELLVLAAGVSAGLCQRIPAQDSRGRPATVIRVDEPWQLPVQPRGYDAVRCVILGAPGNAWAECLDPARSAALREWTASGGRLLLTGPSMLDGADRDAEGFLPGRPSADRLLPECRRLEFFAQASEQLPVSTLNPLSATGVELAGDAVVAVEEDGVPVLVRQVRGFGLTTWSAVDLDTPRFLQWSGLSAVLGRLVHASLVESGGAAPGQGLTRSKQFGFDDLAGQLRMGLEEFRSVRPVNITTVAIAAVAGVLLFSIGDWFLLRSLLRNRALTWITFPLMVVGLCGLAVGLARATRPSDFRVNQLEILDLDAATGAVRGTAWTCIWSPHSCRPAIDFSSGPAVQSAWTWQTASWMGQPGSGLGGMARAPGLPPVRQGGDEVEVESPAPGTWKASLAPATFPPSSARVFLGEFFGSGQPVSGQSLRYSPQYSRLEGTVTNPLPVRLREPRICFGDVIYLVPRDLAPGESVSISETLFRTARTVLNRHEKAELGRREDVAVVSRWIIADTSLPRIASMLAFHSLAGGAGYTTLDSNYCERLEMSDMVQLRRAVLTGWFDGPALCPRIDKQPAEDGRLDRPVSMLRVAVPVAYPVSAVRPQN